MSGDNKKTDKAAEIWYQLNQKDNFKRDLEGLREYLSDFPVYSIRKDFLIKKYRVIPTQRLRWLVDQYFKVETEELEGHFPFTLQEPSESELREHGRAFVKLWVSEGITRDETIEYIKKKWRFIKSCMKLQNMPLVERIRKIENKKAKELVFELNRLSIRELRLLAGGTTKVSREILIKRLIKEKGYSMSPDAIKGLISRSKKNT